LENKLSEESVRLCEAEETATFDPISVGLRTTAEDEGEDGGGREGDASFVGDMLDTPFERIPGASVVDAPLEGTSSSGFRTALTSSVVDLEIERTIPVIISVGFDLAGNRLASSVAAGLAAPVCLPVACALKDGRKLDVNVD
jgi:hypothetical protein